jgi:hypothetical protein
LREVLDRHNVTPVEWAVLARVESGPCRFGKHVNQCLCTSSGEEFGIAISPGEVHPALDACLRYGWLRVLDQAVIEEVRAHLRDDPAVLAVPRTAQLHPDGIHYKFDPLKPTQRTPLPPPENARWGEVDFTPAGAALYRMISADWLGPDWEDFLHVANSYHREEHRYCETEYGLRNVVPECLAKGEVVHSVRLEPIGPWCVYWWDCFPSGYRLKFEVGNPVASGTRDRLASV